MAYVTYTRPDADSRSFTQPTHRLAWGRLLALAAAIGLWVGIIAAVRAIF